MPQRYKHVYATVGHPRASGNRGKKRLGVIGEHTLVAEAVLGRYLPQNAETHHVNGDGCDNRQANLVICQDNAYHSLLHVRQKAYWAVGNVNWRKCQFCKEYDDPVALRITASGVYHRECKNHWQRERRGHRDPRTDRSN